MKRLKRQYYNSNYSNILIIYESCYIAFTLFIYLLNFIKFFLIWETWKLKLKLKLAE